MRKRIKVNPDEPRAGDNLFEYYDKIRAAGESSPADRAYVEQAIRPFYGREVVVTLRGPILDRVTAQTIKRFESRQTVVMRDYDDFFHAFADAARVVRDDDSDDKLVLTEIEIEDI